MLFNGKFKNEQSDTHEIPRCTKKPCSVGMTKNQQ